MNKQKLIKVIDLLKMDVLSVLGLYVGCILLFKDEVIGGKFMYQSDMFIFYAVSDKMLKWQEKEGKPLYWHYNMFSGMPSYVTNTGEASSISDFIHKAIGGFLPISASTFFRYLFCSYLSLRFLGIKIIYALIGSILFGFFSHNVIILTAGHITKAWTLAYSSLVMSGMLRLLLTKDIIQGGIILLLGGILMFGGGHIQIAYYTLIACGIFWLVFAIWFIWKEKNIKIPIFSGILLSLSVGLGILSHARHFYYLREYMPYSIRGEPILQEEIQQKTKGLDIDYLTAFSSDLQDIFVFVMPDFRGGESSPIGIYKSSLLKNVPIPYRNLVAQFPSYFGGAPFTAGPFFIGITCMLLFILFLIFNYSTPLRISILILFVFAFLVSLGKNFMILTHFLINYLPYYSKFRTPSMIASITLFPIVFAIFYFIQHYLTKVHEMQESMFRKTLYVVGGLATFCIIGYLFNESINGDVIRSDEKYLLEQMSQQKEEIGRLFQEVAKIRIEISKQSVFRALFFLGICSLFLIGIFKQILRGKTILIFAFLPLAEVITFSWRYLNEAHYIDLENTLHKQLGPSYQEASIILQDTSYFRVWDTSERLDRAVSSPYKYNSIGGYSAAKLRRYQHLIEKYLSNGNNEVLNMLNVKYIIHKKNEREEPTVILNKETYGPAWLVDSIYIALSPDEELNALGKLPLKSVATTSSEFASIIKKTKFTKGPNDTIYLVKFAPDKITYKAQLTQNSFAVFSEIYYPPLWNLFVNGEKKDYIRVNYVLRGVELPPGNYMIEFICKHPYASILYLVENIAFIITIGIYIGIILKKKHLLMLGRSNFAP